MSRRTPAPPEGSYPAIETRTLSKTEPLAKRNSFRRPYPYFTTRKAYVSILTRTMKARAHVFVSGRVQGVFFRDHTRRWAVSLGLTGWVKNIWDGRVEVLAEGEKESLEALIARLKQGPPSASVENVEVTWGNFADEFGDFRVLWA
jgi:acylphosphatase